MSDDRPVEQRSRAGGMYQLRAQIIAGRRLVTEMTITSGWGWAVGEPRAITEPVAASRA